MFEIEDLKDLRVSRLRSRPTCFGGQPTALRILNFPKENLTVKESKDRVRSALCNSGFAYPDDKLTVNLAPADIKKEGPSFDLPIAWGMLAADGKMQRKDFSSYLILGELALTGEVRPVKGILSISLMAKRLGLKSLIVPARNGPEAAIVNGAEVRGVKSLSEAVKFL
ncbi:MAG: hypothetical protein NTV79_01470, partial [Candidatus Aureabacteria bacterium]|nr:hypothetical protein [Candidatus Auribacterota bacterium]